MEAAKNGKWEGFTRIFHDQGDFKITEPLITVEAGNNTNVYSELKSFGFDSLLWDRQS